MRMRRRARDGHSVRTRDRGGDHGPVDWRAFLLQLLRGVVVDGERQGHLSRCHEIGEERVPLADRDAVRVYDLAEKLQALGLAHVAHDPGEPVGILRFDAELSLPLRIEEVAVALWKILFLDEAGVVSERKNVQPRGGPFAMGEHGLRDEIGQKGRVHRLEQLLALKRFEFDAIGVDDIDGEAPCPRFRRDALAKFLGAAPPRGRLDPVLLLEGGRERRHVLDRHGGVDRQRAFPLGSFDQHLFPIGSHVGRRVHGRCGLSDRAGA